MRSPKQEGGGKRERPCTKKFSVGSIMGSLLGGGKSTPKKKTSRSSMGERGRKKKKDASRSLGLATKHKGGEEAFHPRPRSCGRKKKGRASGPEKRRADLEGHSSCQGKRKGTPLLGEDLAPHLMGRRN